MNFNNFTWFSGSVDWHDFWLFVLLITAIKRKIFMWELYTGILFIYRAGASACVAQNFFFVYNSLFKVNEGENLSP